MKFIKQFASKSRITNAEATVVQKVSKAPSDKSGVIFCRALFLRNLHIPVAFFGEAKSK